MLLKKPHMLRCARSLRSDVPAKYACAEPVLSGPKDRFFARLASEIFLSSLKTELFSTFVRAYASNTRAMVLQLGRRVLVAISLPELFHGDGPGLLDV
jgi:hypothetical protein